MNRPHRLKKGDTIGVVSPASPPDRKSDVTRGIETLEGLGYKIVVGDNVNKTKGFTAASEKDRANDINRMFTNNNIDAIFVTQGGYGSAQLLELLDFKAIAANPKIFSGFSDITSLHLMLSKFCDMVTFHGPGLCRYNGEDMTDYTMDHIVKALSKDNPIGDIELADKKKWIMKVCPGSCEGSIVGGNLTLICASLGTPYEIDTKGKILFFEDVDTEPWIFDHMLSHLRNAGKLNDAVGFVIGDCENCVPFKYNPGYYVDTSIEDVIDYYIKPLGKPAIFGLPLGHGKDLATLPIGVRARLDADNKKFTILESGVF